MMYPLFTKMSINPIYILNVILFKTDEVPKMLKQTTLGEYRNDDINEL